MKKPTFIHVQNYTYAVVATKLRVIFNQNLNAHRFLSVRNSSASVSRDFKRISIGIKSSGQCRLSFIYNFGFVLSSSMFISLSCLCVIMISSKNCEAIRKKFTTEAHSRLIYQKYFGRERERESK